MMRYHGGLVCVIVVFAAIQEGHYIRTESRRLKEGIGNDSCADTERIKE